MKEPARTLFRQPSQDRVFLSHFWHSLQEDRLFKLGKSLSEALSSEPGSQEGLPDVVEELAILSGADWSVCLERYVGLSR